MKKYYDLFKIPALLKVQYILFVFLLINTAEAQISPGELSRPHAQLEGISNCTKCHELGKQITNKGCLDCHSEIRSLINAGRGYHASSEVKGKNCWSCHSEHHGRNFKLIKFDPDNFDHNKTGYQLKGAHSKVSCDDCHRAAFIKNPDLKKKKNTFLGLSNDCSACHTDFHQQTLGNDCLSCHNTEKFRPAPGFDHNKVSFRLTGAHTKVNCIGCHPVEKRNGKDFQKFSGISFSNCSSCHKDPHQGRFGSDCQSCHSTTSFRQINQAAFDHSKTRFPLQGKHSSVSCNDCHKSGLNEKPSFQKCTDCHSDYHKGQFVSGGKTRDCSECHDVNGFRPSLFSIQKHSSTDFSLTGGHLAIPCQSCHYKQNEWVFSDMSGKCIDCHSNIHGKELTDKFFPGNDCSFCHSTESWNTISFDHNLTGFRLTGRHGNVSCGNCHLQKVTGGMELFRFASLKSNCEVCHTDIHYGQFREGETTECGSCHTSENWKPVLFDHNNTNFSLQGAHQKLDCSRCHKEVQKDGIKFTQFKLSDFRCAACHS